MSNWHNVYTGRASLNRAKLLQTILQAKNIKQKLFVFSRSKKEKKISLQLLIRLTMKYLCMSVQR